MSSSLRLSGLGRDGNRLFFRRFVKDPLRTGAQIPSSAALARAMVRTLDPARPGGVVELGPGTGVVTHALIERGFAPDRIVALEIAPEFASFLRSAFPGLLVRLDSAFELERHLADLPFEGVQAVVSSLPLLTQPVALRQGLLRTALFDRHAPAAEFIQFTYFFRPPVTDLGPSVVVDRTAFVPWNVYPATVWRYRRASG
ncbi:phosphatidylethanolamine/phosphatidyl-N-methylethanolamine N-methyltransferase [Tistlia consotensis]|uniref:Phosphatidylethanolamine/phosphatidyl-N-methylethanolamine N-methyltransferase n=1 Tax=Tistlia consotensis USBA 355 TaxID=560819 RepID=A0A1Y6CDP6_9PROT|nr:rRNA adenine N-6-methyltransferase family protein [Tistlia consotensis]SMF58327.1 phosphatidylethanolamine/phosphatidyl-N-methylethanolamine N-methyltransferase [Tistlia consotensis USBA 355]SNR63331.1 phosphatidylethanolamine/phosphatidyl-N-methylethanolamine N-methyltransferase [Tistlia consotensis]